MMMSKNAVLGWVAVFVFGTLSACSTVERIPGVNSVVGQDGYLRDRSGEYLEAETIPRIDLPPGSDSYVIDDLYVIPTVVDDGNNYFRAPPRPRPMQGRSSRQVVIQRIGDDSWIVVALSPSQAWPRMTDYWARNRVRMTLENPTSGIMETGWFMLETHPGERHKFRIFIEPGFQDNSAEIRMINYAVAEDASAETMADFPEQSTHAEIEDEFLRDVANWFADVSDVYQASTVSLLAGNISSKGKADLRTTRQGESFLHLRSNYTRAWGALGLTLDRAGIDVAEINEDEHYYEVNYVPGQEVEEKPGFFRRIFSLGQRVPAEYVMRVHVQEVEGEVEVRVENRGIQQRSRRVREHDNPEEALLAALRNFIA